MKTLNRIIWAIVVLLIAAVVFLAGRQRAHGAELTMEYVQSKYSTPAKLGDFIQRQIDSTRHIGVRKPEDVLRMREGNCISIAGFVKDVLEPLGYKCEVVDGTKCYMYGYAHVVCRVYDGSLVWVFSGSRYRRKRNVESLKGIMYMAKLKTLEEHEKEFQDNYINLDELRRKPCGVACPKCGAELLADYTTVLTSNPPQTPVQCPKCGWRGSIH